MTDDNITSFETAKDRRTERAIDADEKNWNAYVAELRALMVRSGLSDVGLCSATLRALLDVLVDDDNSLDDARKQIARTLAAFN